MTTAAPPRPPAYVHPSADECAKCRTQWNEAGRFAVLVGFGDGKAHVIHHDCPDLTGRDWWTEAALLPPGGKSRGVRYRTRPRAVHLEEEIAAAVEVIRSVALNHRQFTAAAWRIQLDQLGISKQARSDAERRAVTVLHLLDMVDLHGGRVDLADADKRTPQYRSLIYPERRGPRGVDPNAGRPRL